MFLRQGSKPLRYDKRTKRRIKRLVERNQRKVKKGSEVDFSTLKGP